MIGAREGAREELRASLLASRNDDGGWGYRSGKQSRVEPTSFALIALAAAEGKADGSVLARWTRSGGLLIDPSATHVNIAFNAIAALAMQYQPLGVERSAAALIDALLARRGQKLPPSTTIAQDNELVGWAWVDGTFSWLEPTAWTVLALKRWSRSRPSLDTASRIDVGERLVRDRACQNGGWNYGNSKVLDKPLAPYAATTALGLLALQNHAADPVVQRARAALERLCSRAQSAYALALSRICLGVFDDPAEQVDRALETALDRALAQHDNLTIALALYAWHGRADRYEAFRV